MKIKEAIEKGLLTVKTIDGKQWVVEHSGEKVIGYGKEIENDEISIDSKGVVIGVCL